MRILIVGGNGFLGKNLVESFEGSGHEIFAMSRRNGFNLLDINNTEAELRRINPDIIYHSAANVGSVHFVSLWPAEVFSDNAQMVLNLYNAVKNVCPNTLIINPLSNCSYPGDKNLYEEKDWLNGQVHDSVFAYGNSKRFCYVASVCYKKQFNIESKNFIIPNAFGPWDYTDPSKTHALNGMIIRMIKAKREKQKKFEIWGTGKPIREWAYIKDVANILKKGIDVTENLLYPVNIAQNKGYSIREDAEYIAEIVGFNGELVFNTSYQDGAPKKVLDDDRFRKIFPDYSFIDHKEGIRKTVEYYESVL